MVKNIKMNVLIVVIVVVLIVIIGTFLYSWTRVRDYLYIRIESYPETPANYGLDYSEHDIKTSDGINLKGWFIPSENSKGIVILAHGYTSPKGGKTIMLKHAKYLYEGGYSTFMSDFRNFGDSGGDGKFTSGLAEWRDLEASYDYIKKKAGSNQKIGFFGISFGAATSINIVGKTGKGDFLIATVPFATTANTMKMQIVRNGFSPDIFFPFTDLSMKLELGSDYNSNGPSDNIAKIKVPLLIIRAEKDLMVNSKDAQELFDKANEPKTFWSVDAGHDIYKDYKDEFEKKILEFLDQN